MQAQSSAKHHLLLVAGVPVIVVSLWLASMVVLICMCRRHRRQKAAHRRLASNAVDDVEAPFAKEMAKDEPQSAAQQPMLAYR